MVYFYAIFIAGFFLLPSASGHRRLYYTLVIPAVLLMWRPLFDFYRDNVLARLLLAYTVYMMATLLWTSNFDAMEATWEIRNSLAVLSFCLISGYLWVHHPQWMDRLAYRSIWLAAAAAAVSIVVWYWNNPFPASRLEPLGVMHHQNKTSCAYAVFLVFSVHYMLTEQTRQKRLLYLGANAILLSLVLLTQSRTALLGICVALVVMVGYRALVFLAVGMATSLALIARDANLWQERVETLSFRPGIWRQVLENMEGHLWLGSGFLSSTLVDAYDQTFSHAHNSYLANLRDGGFVGLALMLALLAVAVIWASRLYLRRNERIYLALLAQAMTFISMDFDRLLVQPKELWLYFWLPIALIMAVYKHDESTPPRYRELYT
jgi:O-antigen ligase